MVKIVEHLKIPIKEYKFLIRIKLRYLRNKLLLKNWIPFNNPVHIHMLSYDIYSTKIFSDAN